MSFEFPGSYNPENQKEISLKASSGWMSDLFIPVTPAAEVPAVRLSHYQWGVICEMITALAELHKSCPKGLTGAVLQGDILADVAEKAAGISFLSTHGEVSAENS